MSRGRKAQVPSEIPLRGWWDIGLRLKDEVVSDRVSLIAAGVAFYGLLALFPAITALVAVSGLLIEPTQVVEQLRNLSGILPDDVIAIIAGQATDVSQTRSGGLEMTAVVGFAIAVYSASKGVASIMQGLNVAYGEDETRGFIHRKLVTLALTLMLIGGLLIAVLAAVGIAPLLAYLTFGAIIEKLILTAFFVGLFLLVVVGLSLLYRYGPSRDGAQLRWASVGAVVACLLWLIASAGLAFYVSNFGSYNESFGALAGAIILLFWFYISAFAVLLGAELNGEVEAQTHRDTTKGEDEPMGDRDAVKADASGDAAR